MWSGVTLNDLETKFFHNLASEGLILMYYLPSLKKIQIWLFIAFSGIFVLWWPKMTSKLIFFEMWRYQFQKSLREISRISKLLWAILKIVVYSIKKKFFFFWWKFRFYVFLVNYQDLLENFFWYDLLFLAAKAAKSFFACLASFNADFQILSTSE